MIIIIDEASAKLASFYYHGEIFKLQWRSVAGIYVRRAARKTVWCTTGKVAG